MNAAGLATLITCIAAIPPMRFLLDNAGDALRLAFEMFWTVLWPLALGFLLSACVETFVSKQAISRLLGRDGVRSAEPCDAVRRGVVLVLVRRGGRCPDALSQGRDASQRDHLRVRLDEPRVRARPRAPDPARLAVRRRGVRGRSRDGGPARDRLPADAVAPAHRRSASPGGPRPARERWRVTRRWTCRSPTDRCSSG